MKIPAIIVVCCVAVLLLAQNLLAIPAFARKYDMSCSTCHAPVPKLKPYGEQFAASGFRLEGKEPPRYFRETGDDQLLLMRELPLAIRIDGFAEMEQNGGVQTDFRTPFVMKLLSGGQITNSVSYYFYFMMTEEGTVVGPEDAFLQFSGIFGTPVDLVVGQFQVSDPLFKRELRLTLEDYRVYKTAVGFSTATLTYDRGITLSYGLPTGTDLVLSVVNGNGIGAPAASGFQDNDKNKNLMLRASHDVSGHVRIGAFGYVGKEDQRSTSNRTLMAGPDLTVELGKFQFNGQVVRRIDSNPSFVAAAADKTTDGFFGELIYSPDGDKSTWHGVLLHNLVTSDVSGLAWNSLTASYQRIVARNLKVVGEITADLQHKTNRLTLGFVAAF